MKYSYSSRHRTSASPYQRSSNTLAQRSRHPLPKRLSIFHWVYQLFGHVICSIWLKIASHTIDAIHELQGPTNTMELRFILDLWNIFRRFVSKFVRLATPLSKKLRLDQPIKLGPIDEVALSAMNAFREALVPLPVLGIPTLSGRMMPSTDAWDKQVGFVLHQKQEDETMRHIGYWSGSRNDAEWKYYTAQRNCLGAVWWAIIILLLLRMNTVNSPNWSWLLQMDPESNRQHWLSRTMATSSIGIWLCLRLQCWHKRPSGWCIAPSTYGRERPNTSGWRLTRPRHRRAGKRWAIHRCNKHLI